MTKETSEKAAKALHCKHEYLIDSDLSEKKFELLTKLYRNMKNGKGDELIPALEQLVDSMK